MGGGLNPRRALKLELSEVHQRRVVHAAAVLDGHKVWLRHHRVPPRGIQQHLGLKGRAGMEPQGNEKHRFRVPMAAPNPQS